MKLTRNFHEFRKIWNGLIVLLLVLIFPTLLNLIPLSALAAVLIIVGVRLGSPKHFKHALEIGKDNAIGFIVTMVITVGVDLLIGVIVGAIIQYLVEVMMGLKVKDTMNPDVVENCQSKSLEVFEVKSALIFSNFLLLRERIMTCMNEGLNVQLDLTNFEYIDHIVVEQFEDIERILKSNSKTFEIKYSLYHEQLGNDPTSGIKKS